MSDQSKQKGSTPVPPRGGRKGGRPGPRPAAAGGAPATRRPPGRRAAAEARRRRRRNLLALVAVVAVVAIVAVIVVLGVQSTNAKATPRTPIPAAQVTALTTVPIPDLVSANNKVSPTNLVGAETLTGAPLKAANGKPQILFIGAEFCPICATERWAMTVALSQFGTFNNLSQTRSAVRDGNLATLSFYGSTYSSPYFEFTPVEALTNIPKGNSYTTLQKPTAEQQKLWTDTLAQFGQQPGFPFLDIGGKYLIYTAQYNEQNLSGLNFNQIAADVGNNDTTVGAEIDASAAQLVHYICGITNNQPAKACAPTADIRLAAPPSSQAQTSPAGG